MKRFLGVVILLAILPFTAMSQTSPNNQPPDSALTPEEICMQSRLDADYDFNMNKQVAWFGGGCVFSIFGLGAAYLLPAKPPAWSLVGKSPEYVNTYTMCYEEKFRAKRTTSALWGFAIGSALGIGAIIIISVGGS